MDSTKRFINNLGVPRLIIISLFLSLCIAALVLQMDLGKLMSDALVRMGMNGVLVLAMVPGVLCGIGLNFGISIGIVCGLLGGLISIEMDLRGFSALFVAIGISIPFSIIMGYLYAVLLNRTKGSEMTVSTYAGFSVISLFCIVWLLAPFNSLEIKWPIGDGLRTTITLQDRYAQVLDKFMAINIGSLTIPTGLLLFFFICCVLMAVFLKSKSGIAMSTAGDNPRFAEASGIDVNRARILGTVISTVLGAVGVIVYAQSYGFYQLYQAPLMMPFGAVAAILIGGASAKKANMIHVILGVFLFQGLLTFSLPIANKIVTEGGLSEIMRIIVQYGIILYALTKVKGAD
ncbi:MAG: ABC transporter permease subunit [Filifactoraceae bacterium]